jgi:hypothetical protein
MAKKKFTIDDLISGLSNGIRKDSDLSVVEWIQKHNILTEDGIPFDFTEKKFLVDFYNDLSPQQAIMASSQVGKTVGEYAKGLFMGLEKNMHVIFSEPTEKLRDDLTKSKLNPMIENNEIFRTQVSGDLNLKRMGKRNLFLTYTNGNAAAIGITAQVVIADECARSNPMTLDMLKSRTSSFKEAYTWYISNPWLPGDYMDRMFQLSDQKHWFITCSRCNYEQIVNFDGLYDRYKGNVCRERKMFVCQKCDQEMRYEDRVNGRWVKRFNDSDVSGYWIHKLMRPEVNVAEILLDEQTKDKQYFYNMVLGLPYGGSEITFSTAKIRENTTNPAQFQDNVVMGLDLGYSTGHYYMIASGNTVFKIGKAKDMAEVERLIVEYNVRYLVSDNQPDHESICNLQAKFPNHVLRCRYLSHNSTKDEIITVDEEKGMVYVKRHIQFDMLAEHISKGKYKFALRDTSPEYEEMCKHFSVLSKETTVDAAGNSVYKWNAPDGVADHFAHAFLYMTIAQWRLDSTTPRFGVYYADQVQQKAERQEFDDFEQGNESNKTWLEY